LLQDILKLAESCIINIGRDLKPIADKEHADIRRARIALYRWLKRASGDRRGRISHL